MRVRAVGGWRLWMVALLLCGLSSSSVAEDIYVVPDRYIIQRNAQSVQALSPEQVSYTVVNPTEFFDVVAPSRYAISDATAVSSGAELLNPVKVAGDCAEILKDPTVSTCEPDALFFPSALPNDPGVSTQWYLHDPTRDGDIEAPSAWDSGTGSMDVLIGVLDTGVYWSHPDLVDNLWSNPTEPVDGVDNDGNGYIDDVFGVNTVTRSSNPNDPHGHGTHVAGIIGARGDNGAGISGVMWRVSLIGVSATTSPSGTFTTSSLVAGLNYFYGLKTRGHNVRAVNASWGGGPYSSVMYQAISRLDSVDILLVCAAGNENNNNDIHPHYPSNFNLPNVVSVGATGPTVQSSTYTNYGNSVDIAAPGGDSNVGAGALIYSTYTSATPGQSVYESLQGTSMAAPVVTGALGLLASQRPYLTGAHLRSILLSSADTVSGLAPYVNSGRFLNIGAMSAAAGPADECPSDSDKLVPGACGCGVAESYVDSDSDGDLDCNESCPNDPRKSSPGLCGCGALDDDSNGNGTADCLDPPDQCPSDPVKSEPGVCGCGTGDDDTNLNGVVDCLDPKVTGVVPAIPIIKVVKGRVSVAMTAMSGVTYAVKVTIQAPKVKGKPVSKAKTDYRISTSPSYGIKKLKAKTKVTISYAYVLQGTPLRVSRYSVGKTVTAK